MVGSALARIVVSSEPMNTGSSTPSTTMSVSRCVSWLWLDGVPASIGAYGITAWCRKVRRSWCVSGFRFGGLNGFPDGVGRRRHLDVADAVIAQRVDDTADDHGQCRRGAAFPAGLDAERIGRRQHLDDLGLE